VWKSGTDRVKGVPWLLLLQAVVILGKRWSALSAKDRARLTRLVRQSRGRVRNLSAKERMELRKLSRRLDVKGAGGELLPLIRGGRKRR
jgi:hypothetical protein